MKKLLIALILCVGAGTAYAQQGVLQIFACNAAEGKNADNVWSTLETLASLAKANREELEPGFGIFLWTRYRGYSAYDFIFGVTNSDLASMAETSNTYVTSGNAAFMGPRFEDLGDCDSSIVFTEQLAEGVVGTGDDDRQLDAFVETFTCSINEGSDMDDVRSAAKFWQEQIAKIDSPELNKYEAFLLTPFRGTRPGLDFAWLGTSPDLTSMAAGATAYYGSKEGQAADERLQKVSTCQNALWAGYWLLTPANDM
jgi:hypothetical protein